MQEDFEHEGNRRRDLAVNVQRHRADRAKDLAQFAFAQLDNERERRLLSDELESARREIELVENQHESLVRDHKNLLGVPERGDCLSSSKRPRTDSKGGDGQHKT